MMIAEFFLFLFFTLLLLKWIRGNPNKSPSLKKPPGPFQWPIIGNMIDMHFISSIPHLALQKLAEKYGDIMSIKFGVHDVVVLSSYQVMQDLLTKVEFSGRYKFPFTTDRSFHKNLGVIFSDGAIWSESRRFTVRTLRDFGFGKKQSMEVIFKEELTDFLTDIKKTIEKSQGILTIESNFSLSFVNVLWSLVAGFRFPSNDEALKTLLSHSNKTFKICNYDNIYLPFPFIRHWFPRLTKYSDHMKSYSVMQDYMRKMIDNIRKEITKQENYEPQNFVEIFVKEIDKNSQDTNSIFTEENLIIILLDLFLGGTDTSSKVMNFAVLYMVLHPEVQRKIQIEISNVMPNEETAFSIHNLDKMPYTKASMYEIFRFSTVAPIAVARRTMDDYIYKDYFIPKGTCILFNLLPHFHDKEHWGDPEIFRPERFLNESATKVVNTERVTVFGFGKRICLGQSLALSAVFLYLTTLLRHFNMETVPGEEPPPIDDRDTSSLTMSPKPFRIQLTSRI